jgi:hypothetical protein
MRDLTKLVHPFPQGVIKSNPQGGSYVAHPVVEQRILDVLGPVSTEVVQIIRGFVAAKKDNQPNLTDACVAVVLRMSAEVDGRPVSVEEVGDCENPTFWTTDGQRLKDAMSDAMRLGVGLHLWAQDDFYLGEKLKKQDADAERVNAETGELVSA